MKPPGITTTEAERMADHAAAVERNRIIGWLTDPQRNPEPFRTDARLAQAIRDGAHNRTEGDDE